MCCALCPHGPKCANSLSLFASIARANVLHWNCAPEHSLLVVSCTCLTQWQVIRHNGFAVVVLYVRGPLCCWDSPHDPSKTCRCLSLWASGEMQFPLKTVFILYLNLTWIVWKGYIFVLPRCKITAKINLSHLKVCPGQTPRGEKNRILPSGGWK